MKNEIVQMLTIASEAILMATAMSRNDDGDKGQAGMAIASLSRSIFALARNPNTWDLWPRIATYRDAMAHPQRKAAMLFWVAAVEELEGVDPTDQPEDWSPRPHQEKPAHVVITSTRFVRGGAHLSWRSSTGASGGQGILDNHDEPGTGDLDTLNLCGGMLAAGIVAAGGTYKILNENKWQK